MRMARSLANWLKQGVGSIVRPLAVSMLALTSFPLSVVLSHPAPLGFVPVAAAATFTVNSTADAVDANPGNGVSGATAWWRFTDVGEPGTKDHATTTITESSCTLSVFGNLDRGNLQTHR
jgi:hypothetical protein